MSKKYIIFYTLVNLIALITLIHGLYIGDITTKILELIIGFTWIIFTVYNYKEMFKNMR